MSKKKLGSGADDSDAGAQTGLAGKLDELKDYFEKSQAELKKVTWPTRQETVATCVAVLVLVVVMSLFLGLVDLGLSKLVEAILS